MFLRRMALQFGMNLSTLLDGERTKELLTDKRGKHSKKSTDHTAINEKNENCNLNSCDIPFACHVHACECICVHARMQKGGKEQLKCKKSTSRMTPQV